MASPGPTRAHAIFCEDIRKELGNKLSYMGVFGPIVSLPAEQHIFHKLCISMTVTFSKSNHPSTLGLMVEAFYADGTHKVLNDPRPAELSTVNEAQADALVGGAGFDRDISQAVAITEIRNLNVDRPCRLQVTARLPDELLMAGSILLIPAPKNVTTNMRASKTKAAGAKKKAVTKVIRRK